MSQQHFDVLIVGAGISGIGMACHLTRECPNKRYAILERRDAIGGTWDLFRYPGIRSDSDMYTFGYNFRPWTGGKVLADGPSIKKYVIETAESYGVTDNIRFGRKVTNTNWSSTDKCWTVDVECEHTGEKESYTANFLVGCTGYYNYDAGYKPDFPGEADFKGQVIHPQHWPENLDYSGKKVVVIGSGATAITLVPTMTDKAEHVTMLQRSPTYLMPLPSIDPVSVTMQKILPDKLAYRLTRARNITLARTIFERARKNPKAVRRLLLGIIRSQLNGKADMRHFSPDYNPWDQRLCVVADGDLFKAIKAGKASMATDHIERFTDKGILLKSGQELEADIIITATGLDVQIMGGMEVKIDQQPLKVSDTMLYKNVLVEGLPNAAMIVGYTNISWTLKADIASEYVCRLLNHMDRNNHTVCVTRDVENSRTEDTILGSLEAGYIKRAADRLPRQGSHGPWKSSQNYLEDVKTLRFDPIEDGYIEFDGRKSKRESSRGGRFMAPLRSALFGA
ncbi:flavin-containing monooxygenase [Marinobacter zhejiangensis]|uniref:Predicted flavoprotein CzcO associated with the cation diffusion facilitator CzcD n=1 Tax=Marinobacter zhejiangensis TaxID=488535 RepID=A0A1I4KZ53_9GAMM|nr:NAD(P)/FAD-dependent oxidoreductase [Marinobacter zhejiangensis]SFL84020.1 Predicted flavoprotein CzcO associated with the cation diffusion facilitator CzcD [Marinobacter zhejiangensis]